MIRAVHRYFADSPFQFEHFAADMWINSDPHVASVEVTRPSRDGGRDAIGEFRIGPNEDPVRLQFALEAKCYAPDAGGVGVKFVSRLARIKHREFGVFVTTAFVAAQAYQEVREDQDPIVFMTGKDLVQVLRRMGLFDEKSLAAYLSMQYPLVPTEHRVGGVDVAWPEEPIPVDSASELSGKPEGTPANEAKF
ncbi:restriction endonuclease [Mycolicibacterium canariasense]|nr:restriction endonuclease [Mycolicibacterium canariasense]